MSEHHWWNVAGQDMDGNCYDFISYAPNIEAVEAECQELLETLDGGIFLIYDYTGHYVTRVEY